MQVPTLTGTIVQHVAPPLPRKLSTRDALMLYNVESEDWQKAMSRSFKSAAEMATVLDNVYIPSAKSELSFKTTVTPYVAQLMDKTDPNCPIRMQYLPAPAEDDDVTFTLLDELGEEGDTIPGTSVVHRYPQRVLFLVSNQCSTYCRFCTRKRMVAQPDGAVHNNEIDNSIAYIASNPVIQDVLLSGGDPLKFSDEKLDYILGKIRSDAPHVKFLRIGSRTPVQLPTRITPELCAILEKHNVQMLNVHVNHPKEITPLFAERIKLLRKAGIMLGNQTVMLKGINDNSEVLRELFMKLIEIGIRPYYVYSTDAVEGAHHFIVSLERMKQLYHEVRGWISGPAVPTFVVDGLSGLGKMPVIPDYVVEKDGHVVATNYKGTTVNMDYLL